MAYSRLFSKGGALTALKSAGIGMVLAASLGAGAMTAHAAQAPAAVKASATNAARASLKELVDAIPRFTANFKQELTDESGNVLSEARGKIYMMNPDHFMMHTRIPDETALYTRGKDIYYYDAAVNQVSIFSMDNLGSNPIILLSSSDPARWDNYSVSRDGSIYTLIPKDPQEVRSITIKFINHNIDGRKGYINTIDSLTIRMDDGNTNFYLFTNQKDAVSRKNFEFSLPPDVEIDDQR